MGEETKNKVMHVKQLKTMRELKKLADELEIKQEEIINIFPINNQIYIIFYR